MTGKEDDIGLIFALMDEVLEPRFLNHLGNRLDVYFRSTVVEIEQCS